MGKYRKHALTALKILVSVALIYFIFTKLDFAEFLKNLKKTNPLYIFVATILIVFSKVFASFRLNLYFHQLGILLTQKSNLKLYLLGMFYNLFLPGGIGGDAYKGYIIQKKFPVETKRVVSALVLDRLSGLLLIFLYSCTFAVFIESEYLVPYRIWIVVLAIASIFVFWGLVKKFFASLLPVFWGAFGYSFLVQLTQLISIILLLKALSIGTQTITYLFTFLISSIISVIPVTPGGFGSREITFYYGSQFLGLDENTAVGISILFFMLGAIISLFGVIYHIKKPALKTVKRISGE